MTFASVAKKESAMLVRLAQTISSKYYILSFPVNLIITIIVIFTCLLYNRGVTICSELIVIALSHPHGHSYTKENL